MYSCTAICTSTKKIFRTDQITILPLIAQHFTLDETENKDAYVKGILGRLIYEPSDTCIVVGFEDDTLTCFVVGWDVPNQKYAYLAQAWAHKQRKEDSDACLQIFIDWASFRGNTKIRMSTTRPRPFERAYGFKPIRTVMEKDI